jgi:polyisoprenoid-binding protein YceI
MSTQATDPNAIPDVDRTLWRIDPTRSSVEFRAPNFWGLATVKGKFERYDGTFELYETPAIKLTIDAASLGMTWNRVGLLHTPSKLIVHGRLVQDGN